MADKGSVATGLIERMALKAIAKLNISSLGLLRVDGSGVTQTVNGTVAVSSTPITNIGLIQSSGVSQMQAQQTFQTGYRRNLIQS
jgi:hypothetical protein